MHVNIYSYTTGRQELLTTVTIDDDGEMVTTGKVPGGILDVLKNAYDRAKSPEVFLRDLPNEFKGTYIRAVRVRA